MTRWKLITSKNDLILWKRVFQLPKRDRSQGESFNNYDICIIATIGIAEQWHPVVRCRGKERRNVLDTACRREGPGVEEWETRNPLWCVMWNDVGMVPGLTVMECYLDRESCNGAVLKFSLEWHVWNALKRTPCGGKLDPCSVVGRTQQNGAELQGTPSDTPDLDREQPFLSGAIMYAPVSEQQQTPWLWRTYGHISIKAKNMPSGKQNIPEIYTTHLYIIL